MHLSKIFIPFQKPKDIYKIHQDLWKTLDSQQQRFLYRIEQHKAGYGAEILMQSITEPQTTASVKILATREYSFTLMENQQLRFLLVANPIRMGRVDRKTKKQIVKPCRIPLIKENEQEDWLKRKLNNLATLDSLIIRPCTPLYFHKQKTGGGKITPVTFEGILTVQKPDELQQTIQNGIGAAKAFGCGLLSIAPIK